MCVEKKDPGPQEVSKMNLWCRFLTNSAESYLVSAPNIKKNDPSCLPRIRVGHIPKIEASNILFLERAGPKCTFKKWMLFSLISKKAYGCDALSLVTFKTLE